MTAAITLHHRMPAQNMLPVQLPALAPAPAPILAPKPMFGDVACTEVYRQAKRWVIDRHILRLYQKQEREDGGISIVICQLWRIDRSSTSPGVKTYQWNLQESGWEPTDGNLVDWPWIPLLPIADVASSAWRDVLKHALMAVLNAAGLATITEKWRRQYLVKGFLDYYLTSKATERAFQLDRKVLTAAMRALRKNVWTEVIDNQVLSLASSMVGFQNPMRLDDYLRCAEHWPALHRIAEEHRNLIPLLQDIQPKHWARQNIFSRRLWVKGERKTTVVDRRGFMRLGSPWKKAYLSSFDSKGDFRWLLKAPVSVVSQFRDSKQRHPQKACLRTYRLAEPKDPVPTIVVCAALRCIHHIAPEEDTGVRVLRAWLEDCHRLWKAAGFAALRHAMINRELELQWALDWWRYEGRERGLPDKQMHWAAIQRHSHAWHERLDQDMPRYENLSWTSPLPAVVERDGFRITPLTTSHELYAEGRRMHHCVGSYHHDCHEGGYLVFALENAGTQERATLGLMLTGEGWVLDQVYGTCNSAVSTEVKAVSRALAREVTKLTQAPAGSASTGGVS